MTNEYVGGLSYAVLAAESVWGTLEGIPVYVFHPVDSMPGRFIPETRRATPYTGILSRKHSHNHRGSAKGSWQSSLYGWKDAALAQSLMQVVLDWGFGGTAVTTARTSKTLEWAEGPNIANERLLGMRVNQATLTGSAESNEVKLALDLMGKDVASVATAQTIPADMNELTDVEFSDCSFKIDTVATPIESFQLQATYGLKSWWLGGTRPGLLLATQRFVTFQVTLPKVNATYDAIRRTADGTVNKNHALELTIQGLHMGTGTALTNYTKAVFTMPRGSFIDEEGQGGREDIRGQQLSWDINKPDTSSQDLSIAYSEV